MVIGQGKWTRQATGGTQCDPSEALEIPIPLPLASQAEPFRATSRKTVGSSTLTSLPATEGSMERKAILHLEPHDGDDSYTQRLAFDYVNWRNEHHRYVVEVEDLEFVEIGEHGHKFADADTTVRWQWALNTRVITRDGDPRPEMGPTRRRTFLFDKIINPLTDPIVKLIK